MVNDSLMLLSSTDKAFGGISGTLGVLEGDDNHFAANFTLIFCFNRFSDLPELFPGEGFVSRAIKFHLNDSFLGNNFLDLFISLVFIEPDLHPFEFFLNFKSFDYVLVRILKVCISRFNVEVRMPEVAANNEMLFLHNRLGLRIRLSGRYMLWSLLLRLRRRDMSCGLLLSLSGRHMHRRWLIWRLMLNHMLDLIRMIGRVKGARDHWIAWRMMVRIHVASSWIVLDRIPWGIVKRRIVYHMGGRHNP
jgi:hypothetical protein